MPKFKYQLVGGKTLTLEGDTQPSDEDVESIAKEQGVQLLPATTEPSAEELVSQARETLAPPPIETELPTDIPPETPVEEPRGFLSRAWETISQPITDLPSRFAESIGQYIDQPALERSPLEARIRGFGAGALQGLGDVISGLTSPINIATTALTGGAGTAMKAGLPQVARAMQIGAKGAGLLTAGHGAGEVLDPESTMAERGFGLAEMAGGIAAVKGPKIGEAKTAELPSDVKPKTVTPTTAPQLKMGTVVVIKANKATPDNVKKARAAGFEFEGINDQGDFRFKKTTEPVEAPILESEVGLERPTRAGVLGPKTDIKKSTVAAEAVNFPRAVMASVDFSAPLRQGLPLIHKKQFWTSLDDMFKAWGSEDAFKQIQNSIAERPLFRPRVGPGGKTLPSFAEDAGLKLTDLADLTNREEALMSTWAEKIPGVRRSNRAYTAFLNKLRADTFEDLVSKGKIFGADGESNLPLARELANFVNTASGRGSLGKLEQSAVTLNSMFFSPRLIASRLQMLNPNYYIMANPMARKEALKSLLAVAAAGNTVAQLGRMAGGTVESDPTSSDFGKIKVGNIRIDPYAGFQQYIVAANRLIQGRTKSSITGREYELGKEFGRPTRLDVLGRFAESKLHPVLSFATGLLRGKDFTGQPFNIPEEVASRFVPIFIQDLKQLLTEDPNLLSIPEKDLQWEKLPLATLPLFGMGIQQYESR